MTKFLTFLFALMFSFIILTETAQGANSRRRLANEDSADSDYFEEEYPENDNHRSKRRKSSQRKNRNSSRRQVASDEDGPEEIYDEQESVYDEEENFPRRRRRGPRIIMMYHHHEILAALGNFTSYMPEQGDSITTLSLSAHYLYHLFSQFQIGPILSFSSADNSDSLSLGLELNYNFNPNILDSAYIYGAFQAGLSDSLKDTTMFTGGLGWKMALGPNVAYNPRLSFTIESTPTANNSIINLKFLSFSILL